MPFRETRREEREGLAKSAKSPQDLRALRVPLASLAPRSLRARGLALLIATLLLAGCTKSEEPVATNEILPGVVEGTVTDVALTPLAGVNVTVDGANQSMLTDAAGGFRFTLPPGEHVLLATFAGFKPGALRANVVSEGTATLAFTLDALPKEEPFTVPFEAEGLIGCRALVLVGGEPTMVPCGANDPNERARLDFVVDSVNELGGAVVEARWTPTSEAGKAMRLTVSRASGEELVELGAAEGIERVAVALPARLLPDLAAGDMLVAELSPSGGITDEEAGLDGSVIVQQPFTVYTTLFYRMGPPAGYSAVEGA